MENKIQELTDKIYREGIEKGNEEAQKLIAKAEAEAKQIVEDARKEAEAIVAAAQKSASELSDNTKSELKMFRFRGSVMFRNASLPVSRFVLLFCEKSRREESRFPIGSFWAPGSRTPRNLPPVKPCRVLCAQLKATEFLLN